MKNIFIYIILAAGVVFLISIPHTIKVRIECKSQYGNCPEEINKELFNLNGKSLSSAKKNIKKILSGNFLVSDFSTQYKLPNILEVNLVAKKAVFAIKDEEGGQVYLTGRDGKILSIVENTSLPMVFASFGKHNVGDTASSEMLFALGLQEGVYQMYQIASGRISGGSLVVELPAPLRVIFPLRGDRDTLLGALRLIYSKLQTEAETGKYSEIDLRFKNPVLR